MLPHEAESQRRTALMWLLALAGCYMIFSTTERCFDQADVRNAITFAQHLRANPDAPTIPEALVSRHPGVAPAQIHWTGVLNSKFYGFVRVEAHVPGQMESTVYIFDVNLAGQRLHPGNEQAREVMVSLGQSADPVQP